MLAYKRGRYVAAPYPTASAPRQAVSRLLARNPHLPGFRHIEVSMRASNAHAFAVSRTIPATKPSKGSA